MTKSARAHRRGHSFSVTRRRQPRSVWAALPPPRPRLVGAATRGVAQAMRLRHDARRRRRGHRRRAAGRRGERSACRSPWHRGRSSRPCVPPGRTSDINLTRSRGRAGSACECSARIACRCRQTMREDLGPLADDDTEHATEHHARRHQTKVVRPMSRHRQDVTSRIRDRRDGIARCCAKPVRASIQNECRSACHRRGRAS